MKLKLTAGLAALLLVVMYLNNIANNNQTFTQPIEQQKTELSDSQNPDVGFLPDDQIPLNFNPLPEGTAFGIDVPSRMIQPQVTYQALNPELQDKLTATVDTTPKFRKGGFRYEELSPEEQSRIDKRDIKPDLNLNKSLVSSISAGGQITNSVNNGGFIFIPADPHGAAGPNQVVNVFNTSIEFYDKDGSNGSSRSLQNFFAPVSPVNFTFDPKVLYDQYEDRFVVVTLERQDVAGGDPDDTSRVLVAVSATSDPNGAWFMTAFNSEVFISGADRWFDYPGFAVDEEVIYLTGNMFGYGASGTYGGVRLWMIDKTSFYAGGGATVIGPLDPFAGGGFALTSQPAHTYGTPPAGMGTYLMGYSRLTDGTNEYWQSVRVDNPTGAPTLTQSFILIGDLEPNPAGALPSAPQSGTGLTVETNDPRSLDAVWRNGQLYTSATIESNSQLGETTASWYHFNANGGAVTVNDFGIINGEDISPGTFTFFPSIAVNADGGIGVGFSASSPTIFPSSYFAVRSPGDAPGTMRASEVIRAGTDFYHRTFGGTNRWGDYSAVAVDPNDECFWVYNKHAVTRSGGATESGLYETAFGEFCNQDPSAGNDTINLNEGATATTLQGGSNTVLNNDSDPDASDSIDANLVSGPADASAFNLNSNGTFSYTHNGDEAPTDSFTYNACDDGTPIKCNLATVNINITNVDDDPTAVNDTATVDENTVNNTINVLTNDTDVDGGTLQVIGVTQPANGSTTFTATNVIYTSDTDYCNDGVTTDDFDYTINGGSTATVAVTVTCQANQDPVANNDAATTDEDVLVSVNVLANDTDPDAGDTLSVTSCSAPSNGTVVQNGNNCDFTPSLNFNGAGGFTYAISDGNGGTDTATVAVTVDPVNDDPTAVNDAVSTNEDTLVSVAVLGNDSDVDTGDTLSLTSCTSPSNGTVVLNGNNCDFTPSLNFNGSGGFTYAISDGNGGTDTASVTVTVDPVNDDPTAVNDAVSTNEDTLVAVAVLGNDSDVDTGDTLSVTSCTAPSNGTVVLNGNNCDFTPSLNFNGSGGFTYAISDGNGGTDSATVTVTVDPVNDDPTAVNDAANTNEDTLVSVAVLTGDSDVDTGDTLSVTSCSAPSNGTVVQNGNNCDFTPSLNFNGSGGFTYAISDGNGGSDTATVTVTVDPVNDDPAAVNDAVSTNEDTLVSVNVLGNDTDVDTGDTLSVTSCSAPSNGTVVQNGNNCDFTPSLNFSGSGGFSYAISDGNGGTDNATVTVTVNAVNDDPVAVNDNANTNEDTLVSVAVLTGDSDVDAGDTLSVTACSGASNGSVVQNGNNCDFTPSLNFNGTAGFSYTISDGNGGSDSATVSVSVAAVNDDPTAVNDAVNTNEDTLVSVAVLSGDSDVDTGDTLSVTSCSGASNGSVVQNGNNCDFTPSLNFNGTAGFSYAISDGNGGTDSATVTVTVDPVNDDPTAVNDAVNTNEDTLVSVAVLSGDSDPDTSDVLSVTACSAPSNGTVVLNGNNCDFTPSLNFSGTGGFSYAISDGNGGTDSASVTVTVNAVNDDPVAVNDNANTNEDTLVSVAVLTGDSDVDAGDILSVTSCSGASNGSVVQNGNNCDFTPSLNFNGTAGFSYNISDGNGGTDFATVSVTVNPINDDPTAVNDAVNTNEDTLVSVAVLTNDTDVDTGDVLSVTSCSGASNGSVVQNGNSCDFTPSLNFSGIGTFSYAISDGNGGTDSATVTVTVDATNDDPVAVNDNALTNEDTVVSVAVLNGDSDPDVGDTLSVTGCSGATNGSVVLNGNNCDFTPSADFNGQATFDYAISDGNGGTDSASVTVDVTAVNDEPSMSVNDQVYVSLDDIGSPPAQNLACQFDFGPADEDASQAVADMIVNIQNDPDGVLSSIDVDNSGALSYTFSGSAGVAEVTVALQDDGGTSNGGVDTSVTYTFFVNVQDYLFRSDFDGQVCP